MSYPTTFRVSIREPSVYSPDGKSFQGWEYETGKSVLQSIPHSEFYRRNGLSEILRSTQFPFSSRLVREENGFLSTILDCYNGHHNLVLRPDDVWTAIMMQLSLYVNKQAERFRPMIVKYEGQRAVQIAIFEDTIRTDAYEYFAQLVGDQIESKLIDPQFRKWVLPSFSTTTNNDLITCGAVLMGKMSEYMNYTIHAGCGIPWITLEGTPADWENILVRLEKLREFGLQDWHWMLSHVLTQFVQAKKGNTDAYFWRRICHQQPDAPVPSYLSGWITAFCVFDKDGNWRGYDFVKEGNVGWVSEWPIISTNAMTPGIVEVDVKIVNNATDFQSKMFAGFMAFDVLDQGSTLKPLPGWAVCLKSNPTDPRR